MDQPRQAVKPTPRLVAFTLSFHMDAAGASCWPSLETIAAESGLSLSAVKNALNELEKGKWITRMRSAKKGRSAVTNYTATIPGIGRLEAAFHSEPATSESGNGHLSNGNRPPGGHEYFSSSSKSSSGLTAQGNGHQKATYWKPHSFRPILDDCLTCNTHLPLNADLICEPCWQHDPTPLTEAEMLAVGALLTKQREEAA